MLSLTLVLLASAAADAPTSVPLLPCAQLAQHPMFALVVPPLMATEQKVAWPPRRLVADLGVFPAFTETFYADTTRMSASSVWHAQLGARVLRELGVVAVVHAQFPLQARNSAGSHGARVYALAPGVRVGSKSHVTFAGSIALADFAGVAAPATILISHLVWVPWEHFSVQMQPSVVFARAEIIVQVALGLGLSWLGSWGDEA